MKLTETSRGESSDGQPLVFEVTSPLSNDDSCQDAPGDEEGAGRAGAGMDTIECPPSCSAGRARMDSEEYYRAMAAHNPHTHFYDSDTGSENGSVIFNPALGAASRERFPSVDSASNGSLVYTSRPSHVPLSMLPYHKRKALAERQRLELQHSHNPSASGYHSKRPPALDTIASSHVLSSHVLSSLPFTLAPIPPFAPLSSSNSSTSQYPISEQNFTSRDSITSAPNKEKETALQPECTANPPPRAKRHHPPPLPNSATPPIASYKIPALQSASTLSSRHAREDSTGSISSIGSASLSLPKRNSLSDHLGHEIRSFLEATTSNGSANTTNGAALTTNAILHVRKLSGSGFFTNLFEGRTPSKDSAHSIEDKRKEYHEKNQAFLVRAEKARASATQGQQQNSPMMDLSPGTLRTSMRSLSPRPPNSRGSHRPGLSSIDNDNWEEDEQDGKKVPSSHRGRTVKNHGITTDYRYVREEGSSKNHRYSKPPDSNDNNEARQHGGITKHSRQSHDESTGGRRSANNTYSSNPSYGLTEMNQDGRYGACFNNYSHQQHAYCQNLPLPPPPLYQNCQQLNQHYPQPPYYQQHESSQYGSSSRGGPGGDDDFYFRKAAATSIGHHGNWGVGSRSERNQEKVKMYASQKRHQPHCDYESSEENSSAFSSNISATGESALSSCLEESISEHNSFDDDEVYVYRDSAHERTSLLPPSGISTHEHDGHSFAESNTLFLNNHGSRRGLEQSSGFERKNISRGGVAKKVRNKQRESMKRMWEEKQRQKKKKKLEKARRRAKKQETRSCDSKHIFYRGDEQHRFLDDQSSDLSSSSSSSTTLVSADEYKIWAKKKARKMVEREKDSLIKKWKAEAEAANARNQYDRWYNRIYRWSAEKKSGLHDGIGKFLSSLETCISNLPLTIGAIALAIVTLGVVWFKFAEENMHSCNPVHFHSSQCTFPEFPGCFYCDKTTRMYKIAVNFHFTCSTIAGVIAMLFFAKIFLARRVVIDEMSSPTTASPAGLICMTMVCVFAGRGWIGQCLVLLASALHLCLAVWFMYMALAYNIMPEPSWFPNTVGIGLSAVKTWLYYPMPGHFLMAISLSLNFFFFPISLVRVLFNQKISAPVCWIQMSAPAVSLYALTIMAQPSFREEYPDVTNFQHVHRMIYLPCMHFLFINAVVGLISSVQGLWVRWESFSKREFSPAHAAFCFPTLAHANAIQAYRGAIDAFSDIPPGSAFKIAIYIYWIIVLVGGTVATLVITAKFFYMIPSWTLVDVLDEVEPPSPNETLMSGMILAGETLRQNHVSPAVLQANESGALVRVHGKYVRSRRVTALGFEPIMNLIELNDERDKLLDWVANNPPRERKKTLSVPGIDFNHHRYGEFGTGNMGIYDREMAGNDGGVRRPRAHTFDGQQYGSFRTQQRY